MPAQPTQIMSARRTEYANRGGFDPADKLAGVVMAYNKRQAGRAYAPGEVESLWDAVKAFNTRRLV